MLFQLILLPIAVNKSENDLQPLESCHSTKPCNSDDWFDFCTQHRDWKAPLSSLIDTQDCIRKHCGAFTRRLCHYCLAVILHSGGRSQTRRECCQLLSMESSWSLLRKSLDHITNSFAYPCHHSITVYIYKF